MSAGRVARAGRQGTAYSILIHNEMPYLLDLYLFLGSKLTFTPCGSVEEVSFSSDCGEGTYVKYLR